MDFNVKERASQVVTPINAQKLDRLLEGYDDNKRRFLVNGFKFGFHVHFEGTLRSDPTKFKNLKSAVEMPHIVDQKLKKELDSGRIAGPFDEPPFNNFHLSPLGVLPKKEPGKFRLIHHLSYPKGFSVNDGIDSFYSSVRYSNIQTAILAIKRLGKFSYCAKTDIEHAFRIVPINQAYYYLFGFVWRKKYYYDRCLAMGLAESCRIFEEFSTSLEWAAKSKLGITEVIHVLDDYLFLEKSVNRCSESLQSFISMCNSIGVPIAADKTDGPHQEIVFLGITVSTLFMEARLPFDKLNRCMVLLSEFKKRKKVTLRELLSVIGILQFATSVIVPGRAFLRRLIDLTKGVRCLNFKIRLTRAARADLETWENFLQSFNGRSFFLEDELLSNHEIQLFTDASTTLGFGAVFGPFWFFGPWCIEGIPITPLEFYPIVAALYVWGKELKNRSISMFTDNLALVHIINKQTSKDPCIMLLMRFMVLYCLKYNILFRARHVCGARNILADALSRLQVQKFRSLHPHANSHPTPIPDAVHHLVFFKP